MKKGRKSLWVLPPFFIHVKFVKKIKHIQFGIGQLIILHVLRFNHVGENIFMVNVQLFSPIVLTKDSLHKVLKNVKLV